MAFLESKPPSKDFSLPPWIRPTQDGILILLWVQPRASKTQIIGPHGEPPRLKIKVASPPVEGAANEEILSFLKKALQVTQSQLQLIRGASSRAKDILCVHGDPLKIMQSLQPKL